MTHHPSIQVTRGLKEWEIQPKVENVCCNGICLIGLQSSSQGIRHNCKKSDTRRFKLGKERARSSQRITTRKRKRNMSLLIGQEAEDVQEQIASFAIKNMVERKGNTLRLKEIGPGGKVRSRKSHHYGSKRDGSNSCPTC